MLRNEKGVMGQAMFNSKLPIMRETTERVIPLGNFGNPDELARQVEFQCESLRQEGWWFLHANVDGLMENLTLFFERDLEV